jgi:hypothetical protein
LYRSNQSYASNNGVTASSKDKARLSSSESKNKGKILEGKSNRNQDESDVHSIVLDATLKYILDHKTVLHAIGKAQGPVQAMVLSLWAFKLVAALC